MWETRCSRLTALLLISVLQCVLSSESCGPGVDLPGVTLPRGDIMIEKGDPLEIFCVLNPDHRLAKGRTSSHLFFYHNERRVPDEFVSVVNKTTIRLYIREPPPSSSMYYCKLQSNDPEDVKEQSHPVCFNMVVVGNKPEPVTDFACISHNWENLTCTWKKPFNFIKTTYSLGYRLPGRAGGRILYRCPDDSDKLRNRCFWDQSTNPHYRQPYEYYYFQMTGENDLGNATFPTIKFHHYNHVIPTSPRNLTKVNQTLDSVYLSWTLPFPMQIFPPGVIHWVRYQSEWDSRDHWEEVNAAHLNIKSLAPNNTRYLNVTGLKYANALYDIKVSMKSALASKGPEMWSVPANLTFKTLPTIPGAAPKTDVGSFEVQGTAAHRDIYIYWQHIPEYLKNGDNFEYRIYKLEDGEKMLVFPTVATKAYAKFKGMDFRPQTFVIHSANKEGQSEDYSVVRVPGYEQSPPEPLLFTKIAFGHGIFELSWRAPFERFYRIDNYTIFWCENDLDRPYQCSGLLNWTHVDRDQVVTNITVPEHIRYQFAISANTKHGSSGMTWSSCTVMHDKVVGPLKNVWINSISSRLIDVSWKLDCLDRVGMVAGFQIFYCPIYGLLNSSCKEDEKNVTINGTSATIHGRISNLKPYTTYRVSVAIITKNGVGGKSEYLYNTTLEAPPDTPPPVTIHNVTNTSMVVTWALPTHTNGVLRDVFIYYNDMMVRTDKTTNRVLLENLKNYVKYDVQVAACTVSCSKNSPIVSARTLIGAPGPMLAPYIRFLNTSELEVSWSPPDIAAGPLNYYEVVVLLSDAKANVSQVYRNVTGNVTRMPIPECLGKNSSLLYKVQVRAINIDKNVTYYGQWSPSSSSNCMNNARGQSVVVVVWIVVVIFGILLLIFLVYGLKRLWQRCKVMQDVEVKLPPGLAPTGEKDSHMTVHSWPMSEVRDTHKTRPSADEELLLQKKEEREQHGRNLSGDSSGCSSGHESVSSSITSATHMTSDSGTGADQRAGSPDGVFSESTVWDCASLSQAAGEGDAYVRMGKISGGSVARSTPNLSDVVEPVYLGTWPSTGYISMPSSEDIGAAAGTGGTSYCRVGLDPSTPPPTAGASVGAGYITIASMPAAPMPQSSTYVPHRPKETATKAYIALPPPPDTPSGESYCRMGLHPVAKTGYVALSDGGQLSEGASNGNYVPQTSVFATLNGDHNSVTSV